MELEDLLTWIGTIYEIRQGLTKCELSKDKSNE